MKISCMHDNEEDQNEIESKYLWSICLLSACPNIYRFNLLTLEVDNSFRLPFEDNWLRPATILPNNHFFGSFIDTYLSLKYYFLSDENLKIEIIEFAPVDVRYFTYDFVSCYYNDSIFIFESESRKGGARECTARQAKKYVMSRKRWIHLSDFKFEGWISCAGFNQQIVIISKQNSLLVYDIVLDSYSWHEPVKNIKQNDMRILIKNDRKLYLISYSKSYNIYATDDIYSEWTFVWDFRYDQHIWHFDPHIFYKGSLYYLSKNYVDNFEFKPADFKLKEVLGSKYSYSDEGYKKFGLFSILIKNKYH